MRTASVGFHCPECVAEARRTVRAPRTAFGGSQAGQLGYVTYTLIGINVLVAVVTMVASGAAALGGGGLIGGVTPVHFWGAVFGYGQLPDGSLVGIAAGEYWRLFTAMFLHFGLLHLMVNMWALWILGRYVEGALGPVRYLALYLIAGVGGDVAAYLFSPEKFTAGASGAIFGLFAALFVINRKLGRDNSGVIGLILINLALGIFLRNHISLAGHVGGLIIGGLLALGLAYAPKSQRTPIQVASVATMIVLLVVLTVTGNELLLG